MRTDAQKGEAEVASEKPMRVTIRSTDVQRNFGEVIRRAFSRREHLIVERDGLPVVAIISAAEYDELMQEREQREERARRFEEAARALGHEYEQLGLTEEQVLESLEATRQQLYEERYGKSNL
jgi:prevent-host-death family protein